MLFKDLMKIVLCVLGFILILQGIDIFFNLGFQLYLFVAFWLVTSFEIGVGFCRYNIEDTKYSDGDE